MAKEKDRPPPPRYLMPAVAVGDCVLWHDAQNQPATAMALVTSVAQETVGLAILGPGYHNFLVKDGVRHDGHPDRDAIAHGEVGTWTHRPAHQDLLERLAAVEGLLLGK